MFKNYLNIPRCHDTTILELHQTLGFHMLHSNDCITVYFRLLSVQIAAMDAEFENESIGGNKMSVS